MAVVQSALQASSSARWRRFYNFGRGDVRIRVKRFKFYMENHATHQMHNISLINTTLLQQTASQISTLSWSGTLRVSVTPGGMPEGALYPGKAMLDRSGFKGLACKNLMLLKPEALRIQTGETVVEADITLLGRSLREVQMLIGPIVAPKQRTTMGCWHVRTMAEIARIAQVVEMTEYGIEVQGISESRWKGGGGVDNAAKW